MPKPSDYETLISKQFFRQEPALPGATEALLSNAKGHLTASKLLSASGLITPSFTAAYEGLSQLFRTMFEYREVPGRWLLDECYTGRMPRFGDECSGTILC